MAEEWSFGSPRYSGQKENSYVMDACKCGAYVVLVAAALFAISVFVKTFFDAEPFSVGEQAKEMVAAADASWDQTAQQGEAQNYRPLRWLKGVGNAAIGQSGFLPKGNTIGKPGGSFNSGITPKTYGVRGDASSGAVSIGTGKESFEQRDRARRSRMMRQTVSNMIPKVPETYDAPGADQLREKIERADDEAVNVLGRLAQSRYTINTMQTNRYKGVGGIFPPIIQPTTANGTISHNFYPVNSDDVYMFDIRKGTGGTGMQHVANLRKTE
jgi:hypothetical protein